MTNELSELRRTMIKMGENAGTAYKEYAAEIATLRARLEIGDGLPDGIAARDATIVLQDKRITALEEENVRLDENAPNLCAAFRTTISGPGIGYVMQFKFRTMGEMHQADDEWRALRGEK